MSLKPVTRVLPACWAPYLINGDDSGLSDELERSRIDDYLQREKLGGAVSCSEESWFQWRNDAMNLGCDVLEYTWLIDEKEGE